MTVGELIRDLQKQPQDVKVLVPRRCGGGMDDCTHTGASYVTFSEKTTTHMEKTLL
jgi:hypothetical protein